MKAEPQPLFDKAAAATYDLLTANLSPFKDVLHFCTASLLSDLPPDAHLLVVGAGTGAELNYLAQAFPSWRFTVVEPSPAMMDICRERCEERGSLGRCNLHVGYLDSLPPGEAFSAATSILVSQFLLEPTTRGSFFEQIATRLKPGGILISADLARDSGPQGDELIRIWSRFQTKTTFTPETIALVRQISPGSQARPAVWPPEQISELIASAGFTTPLLFLQTFMIHAWVAHKV